MHGRPRPRPRGQRNRNGQGDRRSSRSIQTRVLRIVLPRLTLMTVGDVCTQVLFGRDEGDVVAQQPWRGRTGAYAAVVRFSSTDTAVSEPILNEGRHAPGKAGQPRLFPQVGTPHDRLTGRGHLRRLTRMNRVPQPKRRKVGLDLSMSEFWARFGGGVRGDERRLGRRCQLPQHGRRRSFPRTGTGPLEMIHRESVSGESRSYVPLDWPCRSR